MVHAASYPNGSKEVCMKAFKWVLCLLLILAVASVAFAQKKTTLVYLSKWSEGEVTQKSSTAPSRPGSGPPR
jgi:hypothetical protein